MGGGNQDRPESNRPTTRGLHFSATAGYCQEEVRKGVARLSDIQIFKIFTPFKKQTHQQQQNLVDPTEAGQTWPCEPPVWDFRFMVCAYMKKCKIILQSDLSCISYKLFILPRKGFYKLRIYKYLPISSILQFCLFAFKSESLWDFFFHIKYNIRL